MRIGLLGVVVTVAVAGCTQMRWTHQSGDTSNFQSDLAACEYESIKYAGGYDSSLNTAIGQGIEMGMRRNEIKAACLQSKGYYRTPVN